MIKSLQKLCETDNRLDVVTALLREREIPHSLLPYQHGTNVRVAFGNPGIVIGAHYDAIPNVPGANDNGASVIELIELATRLHRRQFSGDLSILFFDKEESLCYGKIEEMGSWHYASTEATAFALILDVCGTGECIVTSGDRLDFETDSSIVLPPSDRMIQKTIRKEN